MKAPAAPVPSVQWETSWMAGRTAITWGSAAWEPFLPWTLQTRAAQLRLHLRITWGTFKRRAEAWVYPGQLNLHLQGDGWWLQCLIRAPHQTQLPSVFGLARETPFVADVGGRNKCWVAGSLICPVFVGWLGWSALAHVFSRRPTGALPALCPPF